MRNTLEKVINKASQKAASEEGTYLGDDGLRHCIKCGGRKQTKAYVFGEERIVSCICQCDVEKIEAKESEQKAREKAEIIKRYRAAGFPEAELVNATFAKDDLNNAALSKALKRYVESFEMLKEKGKGLVLYGPVGTGKTFAAACVVNALIDNGHPCLVTNFARLINTLQGKFEGRQEYIDSLNKFDLLVIDDLSAERDTEYVSEIIYTIIDSRYRAGLPMVLTTNLTIDELKRPGEIKKQRIYNRILERCYPIEVAGINRRGKIFKEEYNSMRDLLGL